MAGKGKKAGPSENDEQDQGNQGFLNAEEINPKLMSQA
jgi:hypothetical protein